MIIINLATIDFGGGGGSSKPLITEPLIANIWSRGRRVFTPANYNVGGFSNVTINTAIIGDNSALDFSIIGWDDTDSNNVNSIYNADIEYSKELLDKWTNEQINSFEYDDKLVYCPLIEVYRIQNLNSFFYYCKKLKYIPQFSTLHINSMRNMFYECSSLKTIPQLETSNVGNVNSMFYNCNQLQSLPLLDFNLVNNINSMFGYNQMNDLTDLGGFAGLKIDWNDSTGLYRCPNLTYQSVMNVLNNLYDFRANGNDTTTRTLRLNSKSYNLLTADDIAMANNMGWNITT